MRRFFTYIVPMVFLNYYPALYFLDKPDPLHGPAFAPLLAPVAGFGMLVAALHHAGLACLTYTPSPMRFLSEILDRPPNERPFLLLAVGYPAEDARAPEIEKKPLDEIVVFDRALSVEEIKALSVR